MKKLLLLLCAILTLSVSAFAQRTFSEIYSETKAQQALNSKLNKQCISQMHSSLSAEAKKIYKSLSPEKQNLMDYTFLEMYQAKEEISYMKYPKKGLPTEMMVFLAPFEHIYELQLSFDPKSDFSLVMTAALYTILFQTEDGEQFKIADFLTEHQNSFERLENINKILYAKLVLWNAQLTLDELRLNLD